MKVISVIEDEEVIKKILKHLDLSEIKERPSPTRPPPPHQFHRLPKFNPDIFKDSFASYHFYTGLKMQPSCPNPC